MGPPVGHVAAAAEKVAPNGKESASLPQKEVAAVPVRFRNVTGEAGIHFRLDNGARGAHHFIETTTGGCAFFDYNNDGYLDIFLIQAGPTPASTAHPTALPPGETARPPCALYRNNGDGTFSDVTHEAGLDFDQGYAQGVAVADYDNDGWPDLYITAYGGNHLFHNELGKLEQEKGKGDKSLPPTPYPLHPVFKDVTTSAGVADNAHGPRWSTSAAWGDYNNDGRLDLLVCHYARWTPEKDSPCSNPKGMRAYCSPDLYAPESPALYRNNGDGTFTEVTQQAGLSRLKGRNMGAVWLDYDGDGYPDIFISNDLMPNLLLHNNRNGTFTEQGQRTGVAVMETGVPLAGMGIGVGDYDNNGREDLIVTNFSNQPKIVFRNTNGKLFSDETFSSGIGSTTQLVLGWGCEFVDYDLDGYKDIVVGNGHVNDDVETYSQGIFYREPKQLFHNQRDGTFVEDPASLADMAEPTTTRGLAVGDYDNDGDADVLANNHNREAQLFRNDGGSRNAWITFRTVGTKSNRDGIGAKLWVRCGPLQQYAEVRSGSSFASHSDQRITFGLGQAQQIDFVRVRWPSGIEETIRGLAARRFYVLKEGSGAAADTRIRPLAHAPKGKP